MTPVYSPSAARESLRRVLSALLRGTLAAPTPALTSVAIAALRQAIGIDVALDPCAFAAFCARVLGAIPADVREATLAAIR